MTPFVMNPSVLKGDFPGMQTLVNEVLAPVLHLSDYDMGDPVDICDTYSEKAKSAHIQAAYRYSQQIPLGTYSLELYEIILEDNCRIQQARVNIQSIVRSEMQVYSNALMVFHYANPAGRTWRLSYACKDKSLTGMTPARRYTYLLGKNYTSHTLIKRLQVLQATHVIDEQTLLSAFSVEALSNEFFDEYKVFYEDLVQYISGTRFVEISKNKYERRDGFSHDATIFASFLQRAGNDQAAAEKLVRDYVKKFLGRLVFLQFLQKKGWMGVSASCSNWQDGDVHFMHQLFLAGTPEQQADYINRILNPLFFRCLNEQRNNDVFDTSVRAYGDNGVVRIPYLNGGLFEQDPNSDIAVPLPAYFFSNEAQQDTARTFSKTANKAEYPYDHACGLFDFFDRYNFTIDENDPDDAEVGVDPEMLGKIFENLLEDNKDKGAYYTPKEIVRYMCEESLIAYLETECPAADRADLRSFITTFVVPANWLSMADTPVLNDTAHTVMTALREVKICDPAIGSGAFPMGLLNILYRCGKAMDEYYHGGTTHEEANAQIKRHIIQNTIYGVDIEKGAVDIARLRFWLALIVDEQSPEALPNLDYKIMQGNSLLTTFNGEYLNLSDNQTHAFAKTLRELKAILYRKQTDFYNKTGNDKYEAEIEIKQLLLDIIEVQLGYERESWSEKHQQTGDLFTSVQQPIIKPQIPFEKQKIIDLCTTLREQLNNKTQPLPIRAATVIPFFDWQIMFSDVFNGSSKQGFDIVIGNPPYFIYQGYHINEIDVLRRQQDLNIAFGGKLNAYKLFLARALRTLCRQRGIVVFIFQNSFLGDLQAMKLREYTIKNTQIISIDSFPERDNKNKRVFESAKMSVCIPIIRNVKSNSPFCLYVWEDRNKEKGYKCMLSQDDIYTLDEKTYTIPRIRQNDLSLVKKIIKQKNTGLNIHCIEGELNMTFHRKYFLSTRNNNIILKGAAIQRYYWTEDMSQGMIEFLDVNRINADFPNSDKIIQHHKKERIAMQGMTGANDKIRLIATLVPKGVYLANSCNYILSNDEKYDLKYVLGLFNSYLMNWYFRRFSTNSNVNGYEVDSLPLKGLSIAQQQPIIDLVDEILAAKKANPQADTTEQERKIDKLVYQLYGLTEQEIQIIEGK